MRKKHDIGTRAAKSKPGMWPVVALAFVAAAAAIGNLWMAKSHLETCRMQVRNYDCALASCGMDGAYAEAWKDPAKAEELVKRLFHQEIPRCPSGGRYQIVLDPRPELWPPCLKCSHKNHGGGERAAGYGGARALGSVP